MGLFSHQNSDFKYKKSVYRIALPQAWYAG